MPKRRNCLAKKEQQKQHCSARVIGQATATAVNKTLFLFRVEPVLIDSKAAENWRKKRYPGFIIICQISVKVLQIFVNMLKAKLIKFGLFEYIERNLRNLPHALYIYLVNVQTMRKIFSNFVCFSESQSFFSNASHHQIMI